MSMNKHEQRAYKEWLDLCERIRTQTGIIPSESHAQKLARMQRLRDSFPEFAKYYFPHYMDADFGWFHKRAAKEIGENANCFCVLEWPREHAKSVFANIMIPLWLYARGEISGMIVASQNEDKAKQLLGDVQAQFIANLLWVNDYGELASLGDWRDGNFMTTDGIGFWAFGRGQSPRGVRKAAKRPNYAVVDDIDDKVIVRNLSRVKDAVDWVLEDLYGALSIKGGRVVVAGNRIHQQSVLAHLVGDVQPEDPKRPGIIHIKVYAFETKTHRKADPPNGEPAWKERYTPAQLLDKMKVMGYRASRREYFHEHIEEGLVFKDEWIHWTKMQRQYDQIVVYCDPSFKGTKDSDYKAIVALGKHGRYIDILKAWVRQTSTKAMVSVFYDWFQDYESNATYYMEANFMQDLILDEFTTEGDARQQQLPIRGDMRAKPDKFTRVENLSPLFERGLIRFNEDERQSPDMQTLVSQFLAFPFAHDDGPDATEGGVYKLQNMSRSSKFSPRTGTYKYGKTRKA
jgi:predicted phage terminase large subunit-like protein